MSGIELTRFFMWCTIINGGMLVLWTGAMLCCPNLIYRVHSRWFPMSRETFSAVFYGMLGIFKIFFLIFNFAPWMALLIIRSGLS